MRARVTISFILRTLDLTVVRANGKKVGCALFFAWDRMMINSYQYFQIQERFERMGQNQVCVPSSIQTTAHFFVGYWFDSLTKKFSLFLIKNKSWGLAKYRPRTKYYIIFIRSMSPNYYFTTDIFFSIWRQVARIKIKKVRTISENSL